ncbi:mas-related G-protein coupled receptor member X1-like [Symphorus nematophorus]
MEGFNINDTSQEQSFNTIASDISMYVMIFTVIAIGVPSFYGLFSLVRNDHVALIYVINLFIANLIRLCCMIADVAPLPDWKIIAIVVFLDNLALMVSVGFTVCISLERYLVIAHPLWYHCRRTIKISVVVCVLVWVLPLVCLLMFEFGFLSIETLANLLLPAFPLFIFFLGGTLKALFASRVPSDEKRRSVGILVLLLVIYTLLFLPLFIGRLSLEASHNDTYRKLSSIFVQLSPLADLTLYVFMRKGIIDKLLSSVCCCRMDSNDTNSPPV